MVYVNGEPRVLQYTTNMALRGSLEGKAFKLDSSDFPVVDSRVLHKMLERQVPLVRRKV